MFLLALLIIMLASILLLFFRWRFAYWSRRGVPSLPASFPFGTIGDFFRAKRNVGFILKDMYGALKAQGCDHAGLYLFYKPIYMPIHPRCIDRVLSGDNSIDRPFYYNEEIDPLSAHLVSLNATKWRNLRNKLRPVFTSAKLKNMFGAFVECTVSLEKYLKAAHDAKRAVVADQLTEYFLKDITAHVIFGLSLNTVNEEDSPFRELFRRDENVPVWKRLVEGIALAFPTIGRVMRVRVVPKKASDFFMQVLRETVELREALAFQRKDLMQALINLKNDEVCDDGTSFTFNEIAAQAYVFYLAGFETSSTTLSLCLYELARNEGIQARVRREMARMGGGAMTYEAVHGLKYLHQVICETLRKYPPVPVLVRKATRDFEVDDDLVIEKGMAIAVPLLGLHYDPEFFPEPERFDPERFGAERRGGIPGAAYLPFGGGPRVCLGIKMAMLQVATGVCTVLKSYRVRLDEGRMKEPLRFSLGSNIVFKNQTPIYLELVESPLL